MMTGVSWKRSIWLVLAVGMSSLLVGCDGAGAQPTVSVSSGAAHLDWDSASFTVPIDAYAMSVHDMQVVGAAHTLRFIQCATGRDELTADELANVREWLAVVPLANSWYFGRWDAPYIAAHADSSGSWPSLGTAAIGDMDSEILSNCVNENEKVMEFESISPSFGYISPIGDTFSNLAAYWGEGFELAEKDQRFNDLVKQRNECIKQQGYPVTVPTRGESAGVKYEANWSEEQILKASLAEATCSDDMSFTQQVLDLVPAYQMQTISQHEAELVSMKQLLDQRVDAATKVLTAAGVM